MLASLCSSPATPIPRALPQDFDSQSWMLCNMLNITAFSSKTMKIYDCLADVEQQETPLLTKINLLTVLIHI